MNPAEIRALFQAALLTGDDEIDCDACLRHLASYAEEHLGGVEKVAALTKVREHLLDCVECREEHDALAAAIAAATDDLGWSAGSASGAPTVAEGAAVEHYGRCLCSEVRFLVRGQPRSVAYCHCAICRRVSGAPASVWATFAHDALQIVAGAARKYRSSPAAQRSFCGRCGSSLFFSYDTDPEEIDVLVGALDEPDRFAPSYHVFHTSHVRWFDAGAGLTKYEENGPDFVPE